LSRWSCHLELRLEKSGGWSIAQVFYDGEAHDSGPSGATDIEKLSGALRQIKRLFTDGALTGYSDGQLLERFRAGHDAAAFEALVARHGSMVFSVCRGILNDPNDAEDAFQATFLILVKKSAAFRGHVALGPWLYRVAYRVAIRANVAAARRRSCEGQAGQMAASTSTSHAADPDELLRALHEEIARLPEEFRRAVILCDLQRVSQAQAASELRLSERTLQRRLREGRQRLKARLIRRGLAPGDGVLGTVFLSESQLAVPAAWAEATVRAALATVNQTITTAVVSAVAKELAREVLNIMFVRKLTLASATLLAGGLIAWGAASALVSLRAESPEKAAASRDRPLQRKTETAISPAEPKPPDTPGKVTVRGRVLGPEGRPVPGAKLYMTLAWGYPHEPSPSPEYATTEIDGRFQFAVPEAEFGGQFSVVAATAPNYGAGWASVSPDDTLDELTIRLADDGVPITGQIIDLEGKPVPGATLRLMQINAAPGEDPGPWLEAVLGKKGSRLDLEQQYLDRFTLAVPLQVTTDSAGRFRLTGIGRNRLVTAQLDGPTITSEHLHMLTRPGKIIEMAETETDPSQVITYYAANFRHVAAPTQPIVGMVRDKDTQKPLAGVTIRSHALSIGPNSYRGFDLARTTTDAQGRYRLTGMPKRDGKSVMAVPDRDQAYVPIHKDVPDSPGLDAVTADIELKRGVWIEGKITDKLTGQPLRGRVQYFARSSNPNLPDYPGFDGTFMFLDAGVETKEDGSYRVVGLPGSGLVAVFHRDDYLLAPERDDEYGIEGVHPENPLQTAPVALDHPVNYGALARIDPAKGIDRVKRDVTLDPGWTFTGTVVGPDGKPLAGARRLIGLRWREPGGMKTAEFTVQGLNPLRPQGFRDIIFQHAEKGLVGVAHPPKNKGGSVMVQMRPGAWVTGRLVDADGQPRAGVELKVAFRAENTSPIWWWAKYSPGRIRTDREGRFCVKALLPGYQFRLADGKRVLFFGGDTLGSGQAKDLGDVKLKAQKE
jgi:RNA polymerase sigma factor (sigma-70 family)